MGALAALLLELIASEGLDVVLAYLVQAGVLPAWVIGGQEAAIEHEPYGIEALADSSNAAIQNPIYGLQAIMRQVNRIAIDSTAVTAAVNQLSTQVSNLPVPPATGDIASAVWSFRATLEDDIAWNHLMFLENLGKNLGLLAAFPLQGDPFLVVEASWKYPAD